MVECAEYVCASRDTGVQRSKINSSSTHTTTQNYTWNEQNIQSIIQQKKRKQSLYTVSANQVVKAINRPWWRSKYNMEIKHWNGRCAKDVCASRDTVVQKEQNK